MEGSPVGIPEAPQLSVDEQLRVLCGLREKTIERVELAADAPHLRLSLTGGITLMIRGNDPDYESWNLGVAFADPSAPPTMVVVGPGGSLAVWARESLAQEASSRRTRG